MAAKEFIEKFFEKYNRDNTTSLAASVAFYTALSLAPLLILFVTASSYLNTGLQMQFLAQAQELVGAEGATAIEMIMQNAKERKELSSIGSIFGLFTVLFSASLIFGELRTALDKIFSNNEMEEQVSYARMTWDFFRSRVLNIILVLSFILMLIFSVALSSVLSRFVGTLQNFSLILYDVVFSMLSFSVLFTLVYRFFPTRRLRWRQALRSGVLTSILFTSGKQLIGLYLGGAALSSSYGAAGSIIVLLVWVYYSALITLVGAELSSLMEPPKKEAIT